MIGITPYIIVTVWLVGSASCHGLVSPCPDIFQYEPKVDEDFAKRWYGVINIQTTESLFGLWVDIVLTSKADSLGNWYGHVTSRDNQEFSIQNPMFKLEAGKQLSVRFYTQYRDTNNVPALRAIRLNGREICSKIEMTDVIVTPPLRGTQNPMFTRTRPKDKLAWTQQCTAHDRINALVTAGKRTKEGEWPWHVAIYHNEHEASSSSIRYKCGGSLISDSHVLTAAHCIMNKVTSRPVEIRSINIYLGTHNLKKFSEGVQFKLVDRLEIHPEYNAQTQYKDIAVLRLSSQVEPFTAAVRPVCLWPEDKVDANNVVNHNGSVVGWGYDEYGLLADELMLAELPVVSELVCLRSHNTFYSRYTNNFTYCAGLLQGTSVCNGDSGGGMVFKLPAGGDTEGWFLRGIVSLRPATDKPCDPTNYVIFTDVAKYLEWIKDIVSQDM